MPIGGVISYAAPVAFDDPSNSTYPAPHMTAYRLNLLRQGWLLCDGSPVAIARYPHLFRAIGYIYGHAEAYPGFFLLPDYRGRMLRGVNGTATDPLGIDEGDMLRDPEASDRVAQRPKGWAGNAVGTVQYDALQNHVHPYQSVGAEVLIAQTGEQLFSQETDANTKPPSVESRDSSPVRVAGETRSKNQYVHFLIRAY